jgi:hypothetical protein
MPAKWQQWMPFHIDAFKGSPAVQAMHPAARIGYLYLLADAWQTDDCSIPNDPLDLADKSGLGDELWAAHGPRILRKFSFVEDAEFPSKYRNAALFEKWKEAKSIYEKRQKAADRTNNLRSPSENTTVTEREPLRSADTRTLTLTSTDTTTGTTTKAKTKKPSSKAQPPTDIRFNQFREDFEAYFKHLNNVPAPWDGKEAANLSRWLKKNPSITREQWQNLLRHRAASPVANGSELSAWIGRAFYWLQGPAGEGGKPIQLQPKLFQKG